MKRNLFLLLPLLFLSFPNAKLEQEINHIDHQVISRRLEEAKPKLDLSTYSNSFETNSSCYFYINIDNPVDLASIQFELYFDSTFINPSYVGNECSSSIFDYKINEDYISFTYIFTSPLNENTSLLYINFATLDKLGKANLDLAVIDANSSTSNIEVNGDNEYISLTKSTSKKYCDFNYSLSKVTPLRQNEEFSITYSSYYLNDIAAGDFIINYDRDELELVSFNNGSFLDDPSVTSNYKANKDGIITLSYIASSNVYSYDFLTLVFKVKNNVTSTTDITFKSTSLTDFSFVDFSNVELTSTIKTQYDPSLVSKKKMYMEYAISSNNKLEVTISLEENSSLAAGDFELYFSTSYFSYLGYKDIRNKNIVENLIINITKASSGYIAFHIFNINNNITSKTSFLSLSFSIVNPCLDLLSQIDLSGDEMCDLSSAPIELAFPALVINYKGIGHSFGDWIIDIEATCKIEGKKHRTCLNCGYNEYQTIDKHTDGCDDCLVKEFISTYITSQKDEPYEEIEEKQRYQSCLNKYSLAKQGLDKLPESARNLFLNGEDYKEESSIYYYWSNMVNKNGVLSSSPLIDNSNVNLVILLSLVTIGASISVILIARKRIRK